MSTHSVESLIKIRRGTAAQWTASNHVLSLGEPGYETDTNRFKIGDGIKGWNDNPNYYITKDAVDAAIALALEMYDPGSSGGGGTDLAAHINSPTPHPVYDDGVSLALLYENAKV